MSSQRPLLPPLPSSLGVPARPAFSDFSFSSRIGTPSLLARMGHGPRPSLTPLGGPSPSSQPALLTLQNPDASQMQSIISVVSPTPVGNNQVSLSQSRSPENTGQEDQTMNVDAGDLILSSTAWRFKSPPPLNKLAINDLWADANRVQQEWASVERPYLVHMSESSPGPFYQSQNGLLSPRQSSETSLHHSSQEHPNQSIPSGIKPTSKPSSKSTKKDIIVVKKEEMTPQIKLEVMTPQIKSEDGDMGSEVLNHTFGDRISSSPNPSEEPIGQVTQTLLSSAPTTESYDPFTTPEPIASPFQPMTQSQETTPPSLSGATSIELPTTVIPEETMQDIAIDKLRARSSERNPAQVEASRQEEDVSGLLAGERTTFNTPDSHDQLPYRSEIVQSSRSYQAPIHRERYDNQPSHVFEERYLNHANDAPRTHPSDVIPLTPPIAPRGRPNRTNDFPSLPRRPPVSGGPRGPPRRRSPPPHLYSQQYGDIRRGEPDKPPGWRQGRRASRSRSRSPTRGSTYRPSGRPRTPPRSFLPVDRPRSPPRTTGRRIFTPPARQAQRTRGVYNRPAPSDRNHLRHDDHLPIRSPNGYRSPPRDPVRYDSPTSSGSQTFSRTSRRITSDSPPNRRPPLPQSPRTSPLPSPGQFSRNYTASSEDRDRPDRIDERQRMRESQETVTKPNSRPESQPQHPQNLKRTIVERDSQDGTSDPQISSAVNPSMAKRRRVGSLNAKLDVTIANVVPKPLPHTVSVSTVSDLGRRTAATPSLIDRQTHPNTSPISEQRQLGQVAELPAKVGLWERMAGNSPAPPPYPPTSNESTSVLEGPSKPSFMHRIDGPPAGPLAIDREIIAQNVGPTLRARGTLNSGGPTFETDGSPGTPLSDRIHPTRPKVAAFSKTLPKGPIPTQPRRASVAESEVPLANRLSDVSSRPALSTQKITEIQSTPLASRMGIDGPTSHRSSPSYPRRGGHHPHSPAHQPRGPKNRDQAIIHPASAPLHGTPPGAARTSLASRLS